MANGFFGRVGKGLGFGADPLDAFLEASAVDGSASLGGFDTSLNVPGLSPVQGATPQTGLQLGTQIQQGIGDATVTPQAPAAPIGAMPEQTGQGAAAAETPEQAAERRRQESARTLGLAQLAGQLPQAGAGIGRFIDALSDERTKTSIDDATDDVRAFLDALG